MDPSELHPATYKGAIWFVTRAPTRGGRSQVVKRFPNAPPSRRQSLEDQGIIPREFTLSGCVKAYDQIPYRTARDRILDALESEGPGLLVHPFMGRINRVGVQTYTLEESTTSLGESPLEITFVLDRGAAIPRATESTAGSIRTDTDAVATAAQADVAERFEVRPQQTGAFQDATSQVENLGTRIGEAVERVAADGESMAELLRDVADFSEDASEIILEPESLADDLFEILGAVALALGVPELTLKAFVRLFDVGDDIARLLETTLSRINRQRNRDALYLGVQARALAGAYQAAAQVDYATADDLSATEAVLQAQYAKLIDSGLLAPSVLDSLRSLRVTVHRFFEAERAIRPRIVTIKTPLTSARLLAYRYYGTTDQADTIARLNASRDGLLEGEVRILST